jgi:hypothetical protein
MSKRFRTSVGGWSKTGPLPAAIDAASVRTAAERAAARDVASRGWPQTLGTRVYRLIERLLEIARGRASLRRRTESTLRQSDGGM